MIGAATTATTSSEFMAGVALMDEMLRAAESEAAGDPDDPEALQPFWLDARLRGGADLNFYLRALVVRLVEKPALIDGFAAALGDYIGSNNSGLAPQNGAVYEHLSYEDITTPDTSMVEQWRKEDESNVVSLVAAVAARRGRL